MQHSRFRKSSLVGVLLLLNGVAGCKNGPQVTVCVLDPANGALQCSDANGLATTIPLEAAENFVCFSPGDVEKLLRACTRARGL